MADAKQQLQKLIDDLKTKKFRDGEAKGLVQTIGEEIKQQLAPLFEGHSKEITSKVGSAVSEAIKGLKIDIPQSDAPQINVNVPDVIVPEIIVPEPRVTVNIPKADAPIVNIAPQDIIFPSEMGISGISPKTPLAVQMFDSGGKPMQFPLPVQPAGGRGDFFTIKDIQNSTGGSLVDADGFLKVTGAFSVSSSGGTTVSLINSDGVYYNSDNPLPITGTLSTSPFATYYASDAIGSMNLIQVGGNAIVVGSGYQDNAIRVVNATDAITSVNVAGFTSSIAVVALDRDGNPLTTGPIAQGDSATALRVVLAGNSDASVVVNSGTITTVTTLTSVTNSVAVVALDRDGNPLTTGPIAQGDSATALRVVIAGNSDASVTATQTGTWNTRIRDINDTTFTAFGVGDYKAFPTAILDGSGNQITSFGGGTQYAEGAAASTYTGTAMIWVGSDDDAKVVTSADPLPVTLATKIDSTNDSIATLQLSGTIDSVYVTGVAASFFADIQNPDGRVKVELPTGSSGLTDTELRAAHLDIQQLSGSVDSVVVNSGTITTVTTVTSITNSVASALIDSSGVQYSTSNPLPVGDAGGSLTVDGTVTVGSITATIASNIVDSGGVVYSGSNPVPTTIVSGALTSTIVVGDTLHDAVDIGAAPVKIGGVAMTTNPTAVADGDRVNFRADDLGRQVTRNIQVRDLTKTAYVALANGTETTLLAGVAGSFLDLVMITATNNSSAATQLDIRAVTAGNIIHTMYLPAQSGPIGFSPSIPWPQDATGNNWTIDMPDQTGTTVYVSALFSQEL